MSVIVVILGFVLICLLLVHINLHQKKNELYNFIRKSYRTLLIRHKKITKILTILGDNADTKDIKALNDETLALIERGEILPSKRIKSEILIEDKMKNLIKKLETQEITDELKKAVESYKKTQKTINKNKHTYNKIIKEFMEACNIKPADLYISFEKIDTDYPKLLPE